MLNSVQVQHSVGTTQGMMVNPLDVHILNFLNQFARKSQVFDSLTVLLASNDLLKGGIIMAVLWWAYYSPNKNESYNREYLIPTATIGVGLAMFIARALSILLPYRERPLHSPGFQFKLPYAMSPETLLNWSSFPSDHASLFFALATGIYFFCRRIGAYVFLYVFLAICLPRIYTGLHWPTDILFGALIGISAAYLVNTSAVRNSVIHLSGRWLEKSPGSYHACFFLWTYQIATLFDGMRGIASFAYRVLRAISAWLR
jgi:undecaprenyl-diphosphatase